MCNIYIELVLKVYKNSREHVLCIPSTFVEHIYSCLLYTRMMQSTYNIYTEKYYSQYFSLNYTLCRHKTLNVHGEKRFKSDIEFIYQIIAQAINLEKFAKLTILIALFNSFLS